jgi:hypothetical protein
LDLSIKRRFDDVGFFDSVMLARPYQLLIDLTNAPKDFNEQHLDASHLSPRALEATGVKLIFTRRQRDNLKLIGSLGPMNVYATEILFHRAAFFPFTQVPFVQDDQLRDFIRDPQSDLLRWLPMPKSTMPPSKPNSISDQPATVEYRRIGPDRIECNVTNGQFGYLRLIESFDPGWSATVDRIPTAIVPAMGALLAVPLAPGTHQIVFTYRTPGAILGRVLSLMSIAGLSLLAWKAKAITSPGASVESAHSGEG